LKSTGLAIQFGLWETVGMAYQDRSRPKGPRDGSNVDVPKRTPQVGDRVLAHGNHGAFVVSELHTENQTAKVTKIGTQFPVLIVEWKDLSFLDELDESQNALRIVREATEGH
jgi:hypothetical protein